MTKAAGPGEPPQALVQAIKRLLRPLLRVLIAQGVTLPILTQLLKELLSTSRLRRLNSRSPGAPKPIAGSIF